MSNWKIEILVGNLLLGILFFLFLHIMTEELNLVRDLAIFLVSAGIFTIISKARKQPLIAGFHTIPCPDSCEILGGSKF